MGDKIRLLIVDDIAETRANLRKLLMFETVFEVVGEAENGEEAIRRSQELHPDVVLMDINMPVLDGIQATERITAELPQVGIVILSVQGEQEYLRKAMAAGARDYLTKPPSSDDLINTIRKVHESQKKRKTSRSGPDDAPSVPGKVITVFSTKGGVGKSTVAVNLAAALAQLTGGKTVIVDLDLQFGDIAMLLDLVPRRTIADLVGEPDLLNSNTLESYLISHNSGLKVLPAPLRPEYAEVVTARHTESIIKVLKDQFDYVIIDTRQSFDDITLSALDAADLILTIAALDVLTIKNIKLGLEVMASLHYESAKIKLVVNRSNAELGVTPADLETSLKYPVSWTLPYDSKTVIAAVNKGIPFVIGEPKTPIAEAFVKQARHLAGLPEEPKEKPAGHPWRSIFGR